MIEMTSNLLSGNKSKCILKIFCQIFVMVFKKLKVGLNFNVLKFHSCNEVIFGVVFKNFKVNLNFNVSKFHSCTPFNNRHHSELIDSIFI